MIDIGTGTIDPKSIWRKWQKGSVYLIVIASGMFPTSRDRTRIDVLHRDESVEARSAYLLEELKSGRITVSDLMGPLYGVPNLTPAIVIPPGAKVATRSLIPTNLLTHLCLIKGVFPKCQRFRVLP